MLQAFYVVSSHLVIRSGDYLVCQHVLLLELFLTLFQQKMKHYLLKLVARLTLNQINVKYAQLTVFVPLVTFYFRCVNLHM